MQRCIYLVLTQTSSFLSKIIKVYTREEFSHISIALSPCLEPMYSFGRRRAYNPYWGGFVKEHQNAGTFKRFPNTKAVILSLPLEDNTYDQIAKVLEEMYESKEKFGYDFIGLCLAAIKIEKRRDNKYYCSDFVKSILQKFDVPGSESLHRFTHPCDFLAFPGAVEVYRGLLKDYKAE